MEKEKIFQEFCFSEFASVKEIDGDKITLEVNPKYREGNEKENKKIY